MGNTTMCHLDKKGNPIKKKNCGGGEGHIMQLLRSQIPYQESNPGSLEMKSWSPSHWTTSEFPTNPLL